MIRVCEVGGWYHETFAKASKYCGGWRPAVSKRELIWGAKWVSETGQKA